MSKQDKKQQPAIQAIQTVYGGNKYRSRNEARWAIFLDQMGVKYEYEKEGFNIKGINYLPDFWLPDYDVWLETKGAEATEEEEEKAGLLAAYGRHDVWLVAGSPWPEEYQITEFHSLLPDQDTLWHAEKAVELRHKRFLQKLIFTDESRYWLDIMQAWREKYEEELRSLSDKQAKIPYKWDSHRFGVCPTCRKMCLASYDYSYTAEETLEHIRTDKGRLIVIIQEREEYYEGDYGFCMACSAFGERDDPLLLDAFNTARQARFEHGETPKPKR